MTFPVDLHLGGVVIHPHWLMETIAYLAGFALYVRLRARWQDEIPEGTRMIAVTGAALGAALGSKLLFLLDDPAATIAHLHDALWIMGGKTIVGGLLGGLLGVELAKKIARETRSTGDLFVLPLCLGISIGRVGCFLTGLSDHTYGGPTSLPWGVDFGDGIPRHPVQLYEIAVLAGIAVWAIVRRRSIERSGDLFRGFMTLYLGWRLLIDFTKPDPPLVLGLSAIQLACIAGIAFYARDARRVFAGPRAKRPPEEPLSVPVEAAVVVHARARAADDDHERVVASRRER